MPFRELNLDLENKEKNIGMGIDVTQKCQAKCPTCFYEGSEGAPKEMPFGLFKAIVDEAEQNNFHELYLLGGEPTLHKDIMDLLDYGVDKKQFNPVILVTNGLKLADEDFCKSVADKGVMVAVQRHVMVPKNFSEIDITKELCPHYECKDKYRDENGRFLAFGASELYCAYEGGSGCSEYKTANRCRDSDFVSYLETKKGIAVQDEVMGIKGTLPIVEKAFENIEKHFKPNKVAVQCCITRPVVENQTIYDVFEYARNRGYEVVMECTKAGPNFPRGNQKDITPDELLSVYKCLQALDSTRERRKHPLQLNVEDGEAASILTPQAYGKTCHMPETGVHALIDGTIVPCVGQPYALGKIPDDKLEDILKSDKRKFFQYPEKRIEGHCGECDELKDCTGGCRGDAYYITGCFNASAVQCPQIANYTVKLKVEDFVPHDCNGCAMKNDSACGIKPELKETLNRYLGERFAG